MWYRANINDILQFCDSIIVNYEPVIPLNHSLSILA